MCQELDIKKLKVFSMYSVICIMIRHLVLLLLLIILGSCNPTLTTYTFIFNDEGPNKELAKRMESLLEATYYNVDILLVEGRGTESNLDSLSRGVVDMALVENYVNHREGINSAFSIYGEVLHIFYKADLSVNSFADLMHDHVAYIGKPESPTYNLMMDLFDFYGVDTSRLIITFDMSEASVIVELTNLLSRVQLSNYESFELFSFDSEVVKGIILKYPRLGAFDIPSGAYQSITDQSIQTLSVDLVMMVRSGLGEIAVNDFTKTMLRNRQVFTSIDPLFYNGMKEDFDQNKLNIPLHEGARTFLARDEPSFIERYAELGGVILSLIIATWSGLVSLAKWQIQKKKDRVDEFYEDLIKIKNEIHTLRTVKEVVERIRHIQSAQNKAFELLIGEELIANESFRIYMELSKETINELRAKLRVLKAIQQRTST